MYCLKVRDLELTTHLLLSGINQSVLSIYLLNNKSLLELKFFSGEMKYMLFITFFFLVFTDRKIQDKIEKRRN